MNYLLPLNLYTDLIYKDMTKHSIDWNLQASKEAKYQEFLDKINALEDMGGEYDYCLIKYSDVVEIVWEVFCD